MQPSYNLHHHEFAHNRHHWSTITIKIIARILPKSLDHRRTWILNSLWIQLTLICLYLHLVVFVQNGHQRMKGERSYVQGYYHVTSKQPLYKSVNLSVTCTDYKWNPQMWKSVLIWEVSWFEKCPDLRVSIFGQFVSTCWLQMEPLTRQVSWSQSALSRKVTWSQSVLIGKVSWFQRKDAERSQKQKQGRWPFVSSTVAISTATSVFLQGNYWIPETDKKTVRLL